MLEEKGFIESHWWICTEEFKPKSLERALAAYQEYKSSGYLVGIFQYVWPRTVNADAFMHCEWRTDESVTEYDEKDDIYYVVESWWSCAMDGEMLYPIKQGLEKIKYWTRLPEIRDHAPKEASNQYPNERLTFEERFVNEMSGTTTP